MRKVACLAVFMALMMLVPVQAGENVSIQQSQPQDDNRQPSEENKTLYMFWNDSNTNAWTHFQSVDNSSLELYSEEVDNGLIDIDLRFGMEPILAKRLYMDPDGLFRGSFNIYVEGDWTNDNDGNTACGQNDCDELNISLYAGPNIIGEHHETGLVVGDNTVTFNFVISEETTVDWNGDQFNPEVRVSMKLRGNFQSGGLFFADTGEPAKFEMSMGEQSYIELPVDDASWEEAFQDGGDIGGGDSEDTPGFTLVVASAAIAMAVFVNARREVE
ncbi:MAG: hypothetical protein MKZ54_00375 [Candidatus Poseidoniaceae archaeon]|nr:hypothetical protein [Candidatus Poseidoniaceae archaeon]